MKNLISTIFILFGFIFINSQNYDYGKVSKAELEEQFHPSDSSASAAILYRNETVSFSYSQNNGFTQEKEILMRVKIYNKEGFDWANKKVYLYKGDNGNNEKINGLKATTYNLEGGKVKKEKL